MYGLNVPSSVIGKTGCPLAWMRWVPSDTAVPVRKIHAQIAEVAHARMTGRTCAAGRDEGQHNVVAWIEAFDARPDLGDDACALVPAEHREAAHRDAARDQVVVGVTHPRRFHLDLDFVADGVADLDLLDRVAPAHGCGAA